MSRTIRLVVLALVAALVAAGCGAVDKQAYIKDNNKIQERVAKSITGLDPSKPEGITAAQKELDTAIKELDALEVPDDYTVEHDQMIDSLKDMSGIMGDLKTAMEKEDISGLTDIQTRLSKAQTGFNDAINAMNEDRT